MEDKSSEVIYRREKRSGGIRSVILAVVFLALINAAPIAKSAAAYMKQIPVSSLRLLLPLSFSTV